MQAQATWWWVAGAFVVIVFVAMFADRRRMHRRNLDRPGWVPWPLVLILSLIAAVLCAILALGGSVGPG
jgi:cytochrome bd-type quinol oxidase subunit 2